jgi:hypothetical protein
LLIKDGELIEGPFTGRGVWHAAQTLKLHQTKNAVPFSKSKPVGLDTEESL